MSKDTDTDGDEASPVIVAFTASAGTAASLEALLRQLPPQPEAAFVAVLQHMEVFDGDRFGKAAQEGGHDLLWIADSLPVEPGQLYLNPPDMFVTIEGGRFVATPTQQASGQHGVIDSFLVSLARDRGDKAIGVALAGTDGDATLGAREVKAAGGVVLAESVPEDLAHSDSPAALADAVLQLDDIPARLLPLIEQAARQPDEASGATPPGGPETREALNIIAGLLRQKTGHDFHGYKPGTFLRRVQRGMQALLIEDLAAYVELLRGNPEEAQSLFNDLLIGVTEFFRDKKEWEILEHEVVPRLFEGKDAKKPVRVWVAGCSTGEEAYSLAILLAEYRSRMEDPPQVQIFASDLDGRALAAGRAGRYPDSIAAQLSPERLARWFVKEGDTYCVVKELRGMCIFSQHSLIKDAPFSRLDLISCRNLLIYLDADLQEKVIPLFHFALRSGGFLFLGNSENASRHQNLFAPVETRSRIFRRLKTETRVLPDFPFTSVDRRLIAREFPRATEMETPVARDLTRWAEHVVERHTPAFVVVDESHTILHFSGPMGRYLAPASGAASLGLLQLVHPLLREELRAALGRAAETGQSVELGGLEIGSNGQRLRVDLIVEPRPVLPESQPGFVVIFKDCATRADHGIADDGSARPRDEHLRRLEEELRLTRDRLQATIEELESTNEEMKSSNEEYQSLTEELQSANEELETSKEELQSMNEELTTVNGELAHRVQELGRANSDLKNFMESTQIATLFLDSELKVTNFTPAIVDLFHLVESDEGRPITHIKARVAYDRLAEDARRVLRTLSPVEREIDNPEVGARYVARVLPYRSTDNFIAGVVVTFVDVTARREAEERLRRSEERYRAIVETARDYAIFTTGPAERIETWPPGAEQVFGWSAEEAVGQLMDMTFTPEDRAVGQPALERQTALEDGQAPDIRWHLRKDETRVFIDGMVRSLSTADGQPSGFLKIGKDVTEQRATEAALRASEARQAFLLRLSDALRPLADPVAVQCEASRILAEHLDVDRACYVEVDEDAGLARVAQDHVRGDVPSLAGEHQMADFGWSVGILRRGECHVVADTRTSPLVPAAERSASAALGKIACMGAPLIRKGQLVGALCVMAAEPREWTPEEVATLREVAERIWAAIERARAEAALRQSRKRFAALVEASSQVVYTMSADWREMRQLLGGGFLSDTLHPNPDWLRDYIHPDDQAETWAAIQRAIAGKAVFEFEHRVIRADGRLGWTLSRAVPILDEAGDIVEWFGAATNVTKRREAEAQMMAFGEASSDVLWIRNCRPLAFQYVSPAFERIHGMGVDKVMRGDTLHNWLDMILPEDRDRAREAIEKLRGGERLAFEYRVTRPSDGQVRLLRETGFPIRDPEGQVMWIAGVGHDATEEAASSDRLKVLVAELQHRTRNLLGVVRAIMNHTLKGSGSLDDFNSRIGERLGALARVNGLLSRLSEDDRVDFDELIRSELDAHGVMDGGGDSPQVSLHGPRGIRLRSSTVQTLALGLHELATNALKYGALSQPEGRLKIRWTLVRGADGLPRLKVDWQESGVPVPMPEDGGPAAIPKGYGRELIEQALPYQLSAEVDYDLAPRGVSCTIAIPVSTSMDMTPPATKTHG